MNFIDEYCSSIKDPFLSKLYPILLESYVSWLEIQPFIIGQLLDHPKTELYGRKNVDSWDSLNNNQKIAKLFELFSNNDAFAEVRRYMDESADITKGPTQIHYDVPEIKEPYNGNKAIHLEQFKKTRIFKDLTQIFLNHL